MKIKIERSPVPCETSVTVTCSQNADEATERLIRQLKLTTDAVTGYKDKEVYRLVLHDIFYIESVDDKTFFYLKSEIYETPCKLYEWENRLKDTSFVRISKSVILNTDRLRYVKPLLSGKLEAVLTNGETLVINRHYVGDFRKKFQL